MKHAALIHLCPSKLTTHPRHLPVPLSPARRASLKRSIEDGGIQRPLAAMQSGKEYMLLAGYNRLEIARELGLDTVPVVLVDGISDDTAATRYMMEDNITGRPNTKSATALQCFLYHEAEIMATEPETRRNMYLKRGPVRIQSERENIGVSCNSLAEQYDFDEKYLLDLVDIRKQINNDPEAWAEVMRLILEEEAYIPRLKTGLAGAKATLGKKKNATHWGNVGCRSGTGLIGTLQNWAKVSAADKEHIRTRLEESFRILPAEGFDALATAAESWQEHEIKRLIQRLKELS